MPYSLADTAKLSQEHKMTRLSTSLTFLLLGSLLSSFSVGASAATISGADLRAALQPAAPTQCAERLENGVEIDFTDLELAQGDTTALAQLVIIGIPTGTARFNPANLKVIGRWRDEAWLAKITQLRNGRTYLALDVDFLAVLWGSADDFHFNSDFGDAQPIWFGLPDNRIQARAQLSRALSCWEDLTAE